MQIALSILGHGLGLKPDYETALPDKYSENQSDDIPENEDTQLQKAIEILK